MKPEYPTRRDNLRLLLRNQTCQNFLVTNITNVGYLTGFSGSSAYLLVTPQEEILLSDGRYTEQIASECPDLEVEIRPVDSTMMKLLVDVLKKTAINKIQIESDSITRAFSNQLDTELPDVELFDSQGVISTLRAIKDNFEIETIKRSIEINEQVFTHLVDNLSADQTEKQLGHQLESQMRMRGAEKCSFEPIVAAGPSSALAHYHGRDVAIGEHEFLLLDWGTQFNGYASDLTRMIFWGQPHEKMAEIYTIVLAAQTAAIEAIRDGAELTHIDHAARSVIASAGYADQFNHGLGHGIGLEIHEQPFLSPAFEGKVAAGMVITIEPGIYLPGIGGVRIEDDVLVTESGFEVLSRLPKSLESANFSLS